MARGLISIGALAAFILVGIGPVQAAGAARNEGSISLNETYAAALRCFIANGNARGDRLRAGDQAKADYYEQKETEALKAANVVAIALGRSKAQFEGDVKATQDRELPVMDRDNTYFRSAVADCKAMGLM